MTQERARYILDNTLMGGDFKYAYHRAYSASSPVYPDGITVQEDKDIKRVWDRMPGTTCYYDAVQRIARGEYQQEVLPL